MRKHAAATWKLVAAFAAVYVIWGSTYLAIRLAIESIPPLLMLGFRFGTAGVLLYTVMRLSGAPRPDRQMWRNAVLIGTLTLGVGTGAVAYAELTVPSGVVALLVTSVPFFIVTLDWKWKKGPTPNTAVFGGLILGGIGILLLVNPFELAIDGSFVTMLAMLGVLIGSFSWSFGSLLSRDARLHDNPFMSTAMQMLGAGGALILSGLLLGEGASFSLAAVTTSSWLALSYLFVFGSIIAFSSYVWLMKNAAAGQVATYAFVNPVVAVLLGWAIVGEPLNARIFVAMAILVAAVVIITRFGKRPRLEHRSYPVWLRKENWIYALDRPARNLRSGANNGALVVPDPDETGAGE